MSPFFSFIVIIVGILNIVLFIKIWAMTNDVRRILSFLDTSRADLEWDDYAESFVSNENKAAEKD
jgi:hypothetical protein